MDDFRLAEANFRVWGSAYDAIAELVAAAVALLVSGTDTPKLRILAGDDRADKREVETDLNATLRDLGLDPLGERAAVLMIARQLARRAVSGEATAWDVATRLWGPYSWDLTEDWPDDFVRLAWATYAVWDLPRSEESPPEFIAAARAFLASAD